MSLIAGNLMNRTSRSATCSLAEVFCAALALVSGLAAQSHGFTSVSGLVLGADDKPVANALVILQTSYGKGPRSARTDKDGHFTIINLRDGLFDVRAQTTDRWSEWQHNVVARAGRPAEITLRLTLSKPPVTLPTQIVLTGKIREWIVPATNSLPHDPAVDPAGNVWVTLERANQVARLNPKTGEWKLFTSPTANSGPHGIAADSAGNIWFTENATGKIGRVDANSGIITEYSTIKAADPHTIVLGPDGALWFTAQNSNLIGRIDAKSGEVREYALPTANALPYGIASGADGALWFCEFGTNKIGRMDAQSAAITEFEIPENDARPRRIAVVGDLIYFTDFEKGRLGRFDSRQKTFQLWASPGGVASQPYGISADGFGDIWYCEFASNRLIHFTAKTSTLQSLALSSEKSEVRNIVRDANGRLWLALSGANKLAVVE
jgi:virginiamycin B lyase